MKKSDNSQTTPRSGRYIFILSMPNNNSWNGKWSGEGRDYSVAKKLTAKQAAKLRDYYYYNFGDGWGAGVTVRPAKPREKVSNNFCGYNWMIESILCHGEIRA